MTVGAALALSIAPLSALADTTLIGDTMLLPAGQYYNFESDERIAFDCPNQVIVTDGWLPNGLHLEVSGDVTYLSGTASDGGDPYYNSGYFSWFCDPNAEDMHTVTWILS